MSFPVYDFLERRAAVGPDRIAMEDLLTGEKVTYGEFHRRAGRAAALLTALGVAEDDTVAILCRNRIEFFELLFACARLGAILVPLNWRMPAAELKPLMADCGARVLFFGAEDASASTPSSTSWISRKSGPGPAAARPCPISCSSSSRPAARRS